MQGLIQKPFLLRPLFVFLTDAEAFECRLRQEKTTACNRSYRSHSEEQEIAASPTTQKLGVHFHHLWRPFLEEACGLSCGHGFGRGCVVRLWRRVFVSKVHCQNS